jgi:hypothetical protein
MQEKEYDILNLVNRIIDTREKLRPAILRGVANNGALKKATQQRDLIYSPYAGTTGSGDNTAGA